MSKEKESPSGKQGFRPELHDRLLVDIGEEIGEKAMIGFMTPKRNRKNVTFSVEVEKNGQTEVHDLLPGGPFTVVREGEKIPQLVYPVRDGDEIRMAAAHPQTPSEDPLPPDAA